MSDSGLSIPAHDNGVERLQSSKCATCYCVCEAEIQSLLCNIPGMTDSLMIAMLLVMDG